MDILTETRPSAGGRAPGRSIQPAPIVERLLQERVRQTRITLLLDLFARELRAAGVPLARVTLHMPTLHPQVSARSLVWDLEAGGAVELDREHGIRNTEMYRRSPLKPIIDGASEIRRRLCDPDCPEDFPILADLRARGLTDYSMQVLPFASGERNGVSFASDHPEGFSEQDLALIGAVLPAFAAVLELRHARNTARALLDTYVGRDTGGHILNGAVKRGDGEVIYAVLWYCDLRGFTELSERLPLDEVIALLNLYFDCVARPVEARGGEILKFVGDGMLAIFPCNAATGGACGAADMACTAAEEAVAAIAAANQARAAANQAPLRCGIALHVGEVMYGNIGSESRLDFTVIGPAVNHVSRLETLCAQLGCDVVVSADLKRAVKRELKPLGEHQLKGISGERAAYTFTCAAGGCASKD